MEARRDHLNGAIKDVELLRVESRPHARLGRRELFGAFKNNGHRVYRYKIAVEYSGGVQTPAGRGIIQPGEVVSEHLLTEAPYDSIVVWFDGECPCDVPDDLDGHWRRSWPAPEPVVPDDENPALQ
ncbi:hypothetical protein ACN261_15200 [Micromonospora sp. WMMD723]|uniref:hypothetical protein n=1 Tax=Micromonospora sp. WMMD723 TaxID=3403465 RepID=UPI003CFA36C0